MRNRIALLWLPVVLLISACNIINPAEDIPAYLKIDSVALTSKNDEGTNSHKITDVWVYVDNEYLGAYPLPARFPILEEGIQVVDIFPGIKVNGIAASPDIYPFYDAYQAELDFTAGEDTELNPNFEYLENIEFKLIEGFEGVNHLMSIDLDGDDGTKFESTTTGSFEGKSVVAVLNADHLIVESGSELISTFPENSFISYVEMNYKTDVPLYVGVIGYDQGGTLIYNDFERGVNESQVWKKIYFDLSTPLQSAAQTPGIANYRIVLSAGLNPGSLDTLPVAKVYVDNIKLIHF